MLRSIVPVLRAEMKAWAQNRVHRFQRVDAVGLPALRGGDAHEPELAELARGDPVRHELLRVPHAARRHDRLPVGHPRPGMSSDRRVVGEWLVDEDRQASFDERARALHVFAPDVRRDHYRINMPDHVGGTFHHLRNQRALRDVFRSESPVTDAADVSDLGAGNCERVAAGCLLRYSGIPAKGHSVVMASRL